MNNPYAPPQASVADPSVSADGYQEIRLWSAQGRIGRLRYFVHPMGAYFCLLALVMVVGVLGALLHLPSGVAAFLYGVGLIPYAVLCIFVGIKRAHDMDWSGWTAVLTLIPLVALIWLFKPGSPGVNRFGPPPPPNTRGVVILAWIVPVVAIIMGTLAAIAPPAYQQYLKRAHGVTSQSAPLTPGVAR